MLRRAASNERTFSCFETRIFWPVVPWRYAGMRVHSMLCPPRCVLLFSGAAYSVRHHRSGCCVVLMKQGWDKEIFLSLPLARSSMPAFLGFPLALPRMNLFLGPFTTCNKLGRTFHRLFLFVGHERRCDGNHLDESIVLPWAISHGTESYRESASELSVWSMAHSVWGAFEDC